MEKHLTFLFLVPPRCSDVQSTVTTRHHRGTRHDVCWIPWSHWTSKTSEWRRGKPLHIRHKELLITSNGEKTQSQKDTKSVICHGFNPIFRRIVEYIWDQDGMLRRNTCTCDMEFMRNITYLGNWYGVGRGTVKLPWPRKTIFKEGKARQASNDETPNRKVSIESHSFPKLTHLGIRTLTVDMPHLFNIPPPNRRDVNAHFSSRDRNAPCSNY